MRQLPPHSTMSKKMVVIAMAQSIPRVITAASKILTGCCSIIFSSS